MYAAVAVGGRRDAVEEDDGSAGIRGGKGDCHEILVGATGGAGLGGRLDAHVMSLPERCA
jgi:hypothetical protein